MKHLRSSSIAACALSIVAAGSINAQTTATTDPVGFQTTTVPVGTTTLANPLVNANLLSAGATANTTSTVTFSGVTNVGSLLTATEPYYIEVVTGALEGERFDVDPTATIASANGTVTINPSSANNTSTLGAGSLNGSSIALRKHITLEQLGGAFSPTLIGNNSANSADQIALWDGSTGILVSYYLRADGVTWRQVGTTASANKLPVASGVGFFFTKRTSSTTFTSVGSVRNNDFSLPLALGSAFQAPGYPVSYSPSSLGGTTANGWTGNNSANSADQLQVWDPNTGIFTAYYLRADGTTWRQVGTTTDVKASELFAANNGFLVLRKTADTSYVLLNPVGK